MITITKAYEVIELRAQGNSWTEIRKQLEIELPDGVLDRLDESPGVKERLESKHTWIRDREVVRVATQHELGRLHMAVEECANIIDDLAQRQ